MEVGLQASHPKGSEKNAVQITLTVRPPIASERILLNM